MNENDYYKVVEMVFVFGRIFGKRVKVMVFANI